ncbi:MAG: D-cysteine desulfhydrase family protein [Tissierellia bacterium]|nr:D-cysteine desulfhydrase family protein [Tissierellia bacterium]
MERISLANLPTPINKLDRMSAEHGVELWIKRDDYTGSELSGNKIRKLEYLAADALKKGCNHLITCGGIQSNHARATAVVAARLGIGATLVLRGTADGSHEGNPFFGAMVGANIVFITPEDYRSRRMEIMENIASELRTKGVNPYIIPEGASNAIGSLGYFNAYEEILKQEEELGIKFDRIVTTVGSGGTFAGLLYGNLLHGGPMRVKGINICDDAEYFCPIVSQLTVELDSIFGKKLAIGADEVPLIDGYGGLGYAISRPEELKFITHVARSEGIVLDPVYTGKAFYGLLSEISKGKFKDEKILFIHTGGIMGYDVAQRSQIENL